MSQQMNKKKNAIAFEEDHISYVAKTGCLMGRWQNKQDNINKVWALNSYLLNTNSVYFVDCEIEN